MYIEKIRKDFPFFENNQDIIFFDNAATALKPKLVIDAVNNYYTNLSVNAHRGDYDLSYKVDTLIEETRNKVSSFINADAKLISFTYGTTHALNLVAFGYVVNNLNEGDEILISELEHSSNMLPWFEIAKSKKAKIRYVELDNKKITPESFKKSITAKTKFVSLAQTSNVLGDTIDAKEICKITHENNAICIIDGAQSTPHFKVDVKDMNCDFFVFSGHKLGSPTGVGGLYIKEKYFKELKPTLLGGGMNKKIEKNGDYFSYENIRKLEAGTPNIEGIIGLGAAIDQINKIGIDNIEKYIYTLRDYALNKLKKLDNIEIYNEESKGSTIVFNIKNVFAQDGASYFNKYGICLRSGQHCAKLVEGVIGTYATLRCSFYYYNTFKEIDKFIEVASKGSDFLEAYF